MRNLVIGFMAICGLFLISASQAKAQSCGSVFKNNVVHHAPIVKNYGHYDNKVIVKEEVIVPVAVPVLVPAFQFQYEPPAVPCPPVVQAPVQQHPVQGAIGNYKNNISKGELRELAKLLLKEMNRQVNEGSGDENMPPVAIDPYAPVQPVQPVQTPNNTGLPPGIAPPPGTGTAPVTGLTPEKAAPIAIGALKQNCASCHTGVGSRGDMILFTNPGIFNAEAPWKSIKREIEAGRMPPKYSQFKLTNEQKQAISAWLSGQ